MKLKKKKAVVKKASNEEQSVRVKVGLGEQAKVVGSNPTKNAKQQKKERERDLEEEEPKPE